MLLHNAIDRIMNNDTKIRILRTLFKYGKEWTGRQIAKELDISPTTSCKLLKDLAKEGIINIKGAGKSYLYSLNDKNYFVKNLLRPFFEKENNILDTILLLIKKAFLRANIPIESAALFGSLAKKKETARSDIDLLVIMKNRDGRKKIEDMLSEISVDLAHNFQTTISPYILSSAQFKKKYKEGSPIINEITKTHVLIMGKPIERIVL